MYTGFPIVLVTPAAPVAMAAPIAVLTRVTKQPGVQQAQTRVPQPAQPARQNYRKPVLPKVKLPLASTTAMKDAVRESQLNQRKPG